MNRIDVADLGRADDPFDLQVAIRRGSGADAEFLIGHVEVGGTAIGFTEDGDRPDSHLAAGPDDPQSDFTSVGNQNALEHE
jgi:hypothetical protein